MSDSAGGMSVRRLILSSMDKFSNGERQVARALIAKYPSAALTTVADLAGESKVSSPTVVRFVVRLGFKGFPALQRALVREMNAELGSPLLQYEAKAQEGQESVLQHTALVSQGLIERTYSELPEYEFEKMADMLANPSKTVLVTGGRFSGLLAEYLALHLQLMRSKVLYVGPIEVTQRALTVDSSRSTVLLTLDFRRYSNASYRFAQAVANTGATVCLMTDPWMSPISEYADVVLPVVVESASPFDSILAATAVGESIIAAVNQRMGDKSIERLRQIEALRDSHGVGKGK